MVKNDKSFIGRQADKVKNAGKEVVNDSQEGSIISVIIAVAKFIVLTIRAIGERFGNWLSELDKKNKGDE